jgi:peptidoglycan/xylan/chitin deacetylase (PgdA/CDA1 family)
MRYGLPALVAAALVAALAVAIVAMRDTAGRAVTGQPADPLTSASTTPATGSAASSPMPTSAATRPTTAATTGRATSGAPPVPPLPASLVGRDIERLPTTSKVVALTFDAGSSADGLAAILQTLGLEHVPATFFLTGTFARQFAAQSAGIAAAGHRLGNHSASHPHFTTLPDGQVATELQTAERDILAATGDAARPLFRFPYGDRDARTIRLVNEAGYLPIRWTVDSLGWQGTSGGMTAATVTTRVLDAVRPGAIVLMHVGANPDDHTTLDAAALPAVIAGMRAAGYGFVTLDALLS